jgi:sulfur carrier protein
MGVKSLTLGINGKKYKFQPPLNIFELITYLGFNINVIVIDYNTTILAKEDWKYTNLKNGDRIEILTIAGGG